MRRSSVRLLRRLTHHEYVYAAPLPLGMTTAILLVLIDLFGFVAIFL